MEKSYSVFCVPLLWTDDKKPTELEGVVLLHVYTRDLVQRVGLALWTSLPLAYLLKPSFMNRYASRIFTSIRAITPKNLRNVYIGATGHARTKSGSSAVAHDILTKTEWPNQDGVRLCDRRWKHQGRNQLFLSCSARPAHKILEQNF